MDPLFSEFGIFASKGQKYTPVDHKMLLNYKESDSGQVLQEGISEAGAIASWISSATSYSNANSPTIPFYTFYSMFGFQRVGDQIWSAADARARGFLMGATAGRTTLNGEGLQHQDGHSHILAGTVPNCVTYDPTYGYELAVIIQHGLQEMYVDMKAKYYYITVMNENYVQPAMPKRCEQGIIKGMYLLKKNSKKSSRKVVQLLGSGTILREVIEAAAILKADFDVDADVWSATSFNELRRDGLITSRWNMLHPEETPKQSFVEECLEGTKGPVVASTDYMKSYADQIREFISGTYTVLGTDGFGRSDTRERLRHFFEVDRYFIVVAALTALVEDNVVDVGQVAAAIKKFGIDPEKVNPALS